MVYGISNIIVSAPDGPTVKIQRARAHGAEAGARQQTRPCVAQCALFMEIRYAFLCAPSSLAAS